MNPGKLGAIKQEMAKVNAIEFLKLDILGISKLKWTGMGECNSEELYIYYCVQESIRRNGVAIIFNERVQNPVLGCNLKNHSMITVCSEGNHSISQ